MAKQSLVVSEGGILVESYIAAGIATNRWKAVPKMPSKSERKYQRLSYTERKRLALLKMAAKFREEAILRGQDMTFEDAHRKAVQIANLHSNMTRKG